MAGLYNCSLGGLSQLSHIQNAAQCNRSDRAAALWLACALLPAYLPSGLSKAAMPVQPSSFSSSSPRLCSWPLQGVWPAGTMEISEIQCLNPFPGPELEVAVAYPQFITWARSQFFFLTFCCLVYLDLKFQSHYKYSFHHNGWLPTAPGQKNALFQIGFLKSHAEPCFSHSFVVPFFYDQMHLGLFCRLFNFPKCDFILLSYDDFSLISVSQPCLPGTSICPVEESAPKKHPKWEFYFYWGQYFTQ